MKIPRFTLMPALLLLVALLSCEKETDDSLEPEDGSAGLRMSASAACNAFRYSDTIFYLRERTANYSVSPVTAQAGTYGAYPGGMIINATTGRINVNKSETGLKYRVWFVKAGTRDTCTRFVTISGVNYASRLYRLSQNDTLAKPFYNAVRTLGIPCRDDDDGDEDDDDDDNPGGSGDDCEFDDGRDDDDGDGDGDEPPAGQQVIPQGVDISKLIGAINLKQTVANGTFGPNPTNGATKNIRIYYRLHDASNRALNYIDVKLHYYKRVSDVPASLLSQIASKQSATLRRAAPARPNAGASQEMTRPRPPDIVVSVE